MSEVKHTEGPWLVTNEARRVSAPAKGFLTVATTCIGSSNSKDGSFRIGQVEAAANARLIAAAPDHALICWAMCIGAGRWEPFGDGNGEFCINGMRYSTNLDEFGCPIVNEPIRAAIARARGDQS